MHHAQDCLTANGLLAAQARGVPVTMVRTVHHVERFTDPDLAACQERSIRGAVMRFAVSEATRSDVSAEFSTDAVVVGNGVDVRRFQHVDAAKLVRWRARLGSAAPVVLAVGGVEPRKNTARTLQAFAQLRGRHPHARLWILGGATVPAEACTQVVAGSITVTPDRIQRCRIRRFISRLIAASWIRSFTPSVCHRSSVTRAVDRPPVAPGQPQHVGQVQLALVVGRRELGQRRLQGLGREDIDAGVDLADRPLGVVGVPVLDDALNLAIGVTEDPPVAARVGHLGGEHGDRGLPTAVLVEQRRQGLAGQHRDITVGDDHLATQRAETLQGHLDGVPGAQLLLLHRGRHVRGDLAQMGLDLVPAVPDHDHDVLRLQVGGRAHRVAEQGVPGHLVQQLRPGGLHPFALARGEDDDRGQRARIGFGTARTNRWLLVAG